MQKKKMLITGVSGLLGNNLALYFCDKYEVTGFYSSHEVDICGVNTIKFDIVFDDNLESILEECSPDIIIHCASLTNVDYCEKNKERTKFVNVIGTRRLIEACKNKNIKFVYISTDSVYSGDKGSFCETDKVSPLNYYGNSKYEGEKEALRKENSLILRTNIFGWNIQQKESLAEWILNELLKKHEIKGFRNICFSSIYTFELAKILEKALAKDLNGVYNCASSDSMSKYEFACALADRVGLTRELIRPVEVNDSYFVAKRGKNLSLNVSKLALALDIKIPTITDSLDKFYEDLKNGLPKRISKGLCYSESYPHLNSIPYGRQAIDDDDIAAVVKVLKTSNLTQGDKIDEFEECLCVYTGTKYSVAFNSGTSALHSACLAVGVQKSDEVITSPNTFVASANCAFYCGAKPIFADIDPVTYNIDPNEIEKKITRKTKAIIPVHFAGQSCNMRKIKEIIIQKEKEYNHKIFIIEDACHALGSEYKGGKVGECKYSDMTVLSFHPVKHITTGEGGAVLTNSTELYERLNLFRSHGITSKNRCNEKPWFYEQTVLGFNYRITDIQCALGVSQLKKLNLFKEKRKKIIKYYNLLFKDCSGILTPHETKDCNSNFHLYVLRFDFRKLGIQRYELMHRLKEVGIGTQVHYIPVYSQPYYKEKLLYTSIDFPNMEKYYNEALTIPLHPSMKKTDIEFIAYNIKKICKI